MKSYQPVVERIRYKAVPKSIGMSNVPGTDLQRLELMPRVDIRNIKHDKAGLSCKLVLLRHIASVFLVYAHQCGQIEPYRRRSTFPARLDEPPIDIAQYLPAVGRQQCGHALH